MDAFKRIGQAVSLALISLLTACITTAPALKPEAPLDKDSAYVYGRFLLKSQQGGNRDKLGIAVNLYRVNDPQSTYVLGMQLSQPDAVYAVAVTPGNYRISGWTAGEDSRSKQFEGESNEMTRVFEIEKGKAYYLGDFTGKSSAEHRVGSIYYQWNIEDISYNYNKTDADFRQRYPNLASIPHINRYEEYTATPAVAEQEPLQTDRAYVYGRFQLQHFAAEGGSKPLVFLKLRHRESSATVQMELTQEIPVQAYALLPGHYTVEGVLANGAAFPAKALESTPREFSVTAGEAIYLGDFLFMSSRLKDDKGDYRVRGVLKPIETEMEKTSRELLLDRPQLDGLKQRSAF